MSLIKQLQLNSLLEVTEAINNNTSENDLYRIFYFISISNLRFKHIAHLVQEDGALVSKTSKDLEIDEILMEHLKILNFKEGIIDLSKRAKLKVLHDNIDYIIPITHKDRLLAYILVGLGKEEKHENEEFTFIQTLANIIMVAIENKRLVRKELQNVALQKELEIASTVQNLLLPKTLPDNDWLRTHVTYVPNKIVGGDYYDFIELDNDQVIFCIADVSGKGMPSALLMSNFQAVLRTFLRQNADLKALVEELNFQILSSSEGIHFVTFFVAKIDINTGKVEYINAGHNPPIFLSGKREKLLKEGTTILGALDELPFVNVGHLQLKKGDLLYSYTDGVSEVMNYKDEEYGEEKVIQQILKANKEGDLVKIHQRILTAIDEFRGERGFFDDLTMYSLFWK